MQRLVALLLLVSAAAGAQDGQAQLRDRAAALVAVGKYAEAEPLLTRVLKLREEDAGTEHISLVPAIEELASVYRAQGRNAEAEKLYQRSLILKTQAAGGEGLEIIPDLKQLGGLYVAST
jgi:tetratricopeptide (TPR) repeat protein